MCTHDYLEVIEYMPKNTLHVISLTELVSDSEDIQIFPPPDHLAENQELDHTSVQKAIELKKY